MLLFLEVATSAATLDRLRGGRLHTTLTVGFTHGQAEFPADALQEVDNDWSTPLLDSMPLPRPPLQA